VYVLYIQHMHNKNADHSSSSSSSSSSSCSSSSTGLLAGVKAEYIHLCRVAGNTVILYSRWRPIAVRQDFSVNQLYRPLIFFNL